MKAYFTGENHKYHGNFIQRLLNILEEPVRAVKPIEQVHYH